MTRLIAILLLCLAGCDRAPVPAGSADTGAPSVSALDPPQPPAVPPALRALVDRALAPADRGNVADLRAGSHGAACGTVRRGEPSAAYPFVVTADARATIAPGLTIALEDPGDAFAQLWIDYCATAAELERVAAMLPAGNDTAALPPAADPPPPLPPPAAVPADPSVEELADAPPPGETTPGRREIDSFFNAIDRQAPPRA